MKAAFPTAFDAVFLGKSRVAGEFEREDGVKIGYDDAYLLSFESSEGLMQTVPVSLKALDQCADFDVEKLTSYSRLRVMGDVFVNGDRTSFRPSKVERVGTPAKAAA